LTNAGSWALITGVTVTSVIGAGTAFRERARGLIAAGLGGVTAVGAALAASAALGGQLADGLLTRAGSVTQGSFAEGWRLPFEYLWYAEHALLLAWLASAAWFIAQPRRLAASPRARAGLMGAAVTYACLVLASVVLHAFVVYGRTARQLVPFLCLVAGAGFTALAASPRRSVRRLAAVAALLAVAQAAANFRQPLMQWFPREFIVRNMPAADRLAQSERVIWINTRHLRPLPGADAGLPANAVTIAEASHPLQFRPYQYEGYTPAERAVLRSTDISMRLVGVPAEP
jgi:hypothetical protein